jgi:hypothetical protein
LERWSRWRLSSATGTAGLFSQGGTEISFWGCHDRN